MEEKERRIEEKQLKLKLILIKDFEELTKGELQVLRNYTREVYHIAVDVKIGEEMLLNAYLIFKRKEIQKLETVLVSPYPQITMKSSFVTAQTNYPPVVVPTFDGLYPSNKVSFVIKGWQALPVLTVFYFEEFTEVICLSPDGHFCRINSNILRFDI